MYLRGFDRTQLRSLKWPSPATTSPYWRFWSLPKSAAAAEPVPTTGEPAFNTLCSARHSLHIDDAPRWAEVGDHAAWVPRIAQGKDPL